MKNVVEAFEFQRGSRSGRGQGLWRRLGLTDAPVKQMGTAWRPAAIGDTFVRMSLYAERQSRAGSVGLPLFPSRSRQRDPRPQVGPTVRIHFPPAKSRVRTCMLAELDEIGSSLPTFSAGLDLA